MTHLHVTLSCIIAMLKLAPASTADTPTILTRVALSDPNAVCLDGSPYSYYISQGSASAKFYLNHQGGGWCQDVNECAQRAQTALGSSTSWGPNVSMADGMSREPTANPLMNNWTFVYLPYCDGGSFAGDSSCTTPTQLYFHGLKIRQAVAASLTQSYGWESATDLVVGGCSAGGLAAYLHVDWWAAQAPATAKVRGLPDSGFFLDGNYTRDGKSDYEARMSNLYQFMNASSSIPPSCNAALGYKCLFAYHLVPFLRTPVMALNSAYDATMGDGECGHSGIMLNWTDPTSVNACGNYVRWQMRHLLSGADNGNAVFLDSCKHHCGEWGQITIGNLTSPFAVQQWYNGGANSLPGGGYLDQNQVYPCDACCNS